MTLAHQLSGDESEGKRNESASPAKSSNPVEQAALDYLALGWSLLPIRREGKTPECGLLPVDTFGEKRWGAFSDRPASRAEVRGWFLENPSINLGVICGAASGNLCVIDVDKPELATSLHLPPTVCAVTSRGSHYYYRSDVPIASRAFAWGELRSVGNYCVLPPSIHPDGTQYAWADYCDPFSMEIARLPDSFLSEEHSCGERSKEEARTNISTCFPVENAERDRAEDPNSLLHTNAFDSLTWVQNETAVRSIMELCGVHNARIGKGFRCPLPGHEEKHPSASLYKMDDGSILMHDFHQKDGAEWYSIAEVFAAVKSGKVRKLSGGEKATWLIRALLEAGLLTRPSVLSSRLPESATPTVKAVYDGFLLLLAVRTIYDPKQAQESPYSWRFAASWTQKGERQCGKAIEWLLSNGYLRVVTKGKTKLKASLLALGRPRTKGEGPNEAPS